MRKYREIMYAYLKTQLVWRADVAFHMLFTVGRILFAWLLWGMIFRERNMVADFTFHGMLSYYIVSSFLSELEMAKGISGEISARIRNGTLSNYMVKPVGMEGYFAAMEAGVVLFYLVFDLAAAAVWVFIFRIRFVFVQSAGIFICGIAMAVMGLLFMVQLNFFLGILTLKYEEISTFLMIKDNLAALVTGSIVPLVLFPEPVVNVMRLLPFYYVTYLPSMLLTGRCAEEAVRGLVILGGWCVLMQLVIRITWEKYRRKYDGVGI
jgi:ABC-2 type transport system permease protein